MKKNTQSSALIILIFTVSCAMSQSENTHTHAAATPDHSLHEELRTLRNKTVVELVDTNMNSHRWCMKANTFLNTLAQTCVAGAVFTSSCAGYWKNPGLAFAASGIGVAGIALRGLADYAKKQGKENLSRASALLKEEGVRGMDDYMRADSGSIEGNPTHHSTPSRSADNFAPRAADTAA